MLRSRFCNEKVLPHDRNLNVRKRRLRKKSFKKYFLDLMSESSLTGVSSVITSEHWIRKLIKLLIIAVAVVGFLLQIQEFLELYWEYEAVPSEEALSYMKLPAITICDENLLRRRHLCEKMPDLCPVTDEAYLYYGYHHYFLDPANIYKKSPVGPIRDYPEEFFDLNFTLEYGFRVENNLLQCEWYPERDSSIQDIDTSSSSCGKFESVRCINEDILPGACYKLNSNPQMFDKEFQADSELWMIARWRTEDFILRDITTSIISPGYRSYRMAFHHPGHMSNPFLEGVRIEHGKSYSIKVIQVDTIRLPPPYSTNCFDYEKEWKENQFDGPIRRKDCEATCEINIKFETFGCVPRTLGYPHDKKLCFDEKYFDQKGKEKLQKCIEDCREACTDTHYIVEAEITGMVDTETGIKKYGTPTVAILDVSFDILMSKTIKYKPKYESIEMFSSVGGYLGMWLGWSLVAILDFFEIILILCLYPFTLGKRKKDFSKPFIIRNIHQMKII